MHVTDFRRSVRGGGGKAAESPVVREIPEIARQNSEIEDLEEDSHSKTTTRHGSAGSKGAGAFRLIKTSYVLKKPVYSPVAAAPERPARPVLRSGGLRATTGKPATAVPGRRGRSNESGDMNISLTAFLHEGRGSNNVRNSYRKYLNK